MTIDTIFDSKSTVRLFASANPVRRRCYVSVRKRSTRNPQYVPLHPKVATGRPWQTPQTRLRITVLDCYIKLTLNKSETYKETIKEKSTILPYGTFNFVCNQHIHKTISIHKTTVLYSYSYRMPPTTRCDFVCILRIDIHRYSTVLGFRTRLRLVFITVPARTGLRGDPYISRIMYSTVQYSYEYQVSIYCTYSYSTRTSTRPG